MAFVVLEGIDGSGKDVQAELVLRKLEEKKIPYRYIKYPEKEKPIGDLIYKFLREKIELPPISLTLLYVADFLKDDWIEEERKNTLILANRFFTSTLAYEWALGVPIDILLALADVLHIPRPDVVIYIDVSPEESLRRKGKNPDRFERDLDFQRRVRENYLYLSENGLFAQRWVVVDGERPPEVVFQDVWQIISAVV